jgi:hypothetical protein
MKKVIKSLGLLAIGFLCGYISALIKTSSCDVDDVTYIDDNYDFLNEIGDDIEEIIQD